MSRPHRGKGETTVMPCPRCGYPCQAGTAYCPSCQLQLVPGAARPAGDDQMPDWVRTMQAGQSSRGSMPAPDGVGFSARSLMNDDALPQWLREAGAGAGGGAEQAPPQQGYPAPGYGAPGAGMGGIGGAPWGQQAGQQGAWYGQPPAQNGAAQRLFDESNLPEWLIQPGANGSPPQRYDAYPTARQPAPYGGYGGQQPPAPNGYNGYNPPAASPSNAFPGIEQAGAYPPAPSGALSGNSLIDGGALPGWMRGDPTPARGDPAAAYRDAGGMRGSSLIDGNALPAWLRNQPDAGAGSPQPIPPAPPQPQPSAGPSIANWIGASAANDPMPSWLGQAYSDARVPPLQAPPQPPAQGMMGGAGWPPNAAFPNGAGAAPSPGTLNANALMDESALPEWLRAQGQAPAGAGWGAPPSQMAPPHSGTLADMHTVRMPHQGYQAPPDPARGGFADEPEPQHFSASDLIDPDLLPGLLGAAPPARAPFGAPAGNNGARSRAAEDWAGYDVDADQPRGPAGRGAPIPDDELPDWLQEPGPIPMQRAGPSSRRDEGYDSRRMPVPRDWNDEQYDASQWSENFDDQEYPDDYPDQPPRDRRAYGHERGHERGRGRGREPQRDDEREQERGRGSGRLRGRRGFFGR